MKINSNVFIFQIGLIISALSLLPAKTVLCQGNSAHLWLDQNLVYFKIPVSSDGIHRISFETLVKAGLETKPVPAADIAIFNFGKEQPVFVSSEVFQQGEYIEFYGRKNTIGLDTFLYEKWKTDLFNTEYSLVNDTNAYFFTIQPGKSHLRLTSQNPEPAPDSIKAVPYCWRDTKLVFSDTYFKNKYGDIIYSQLEPSEGFGSGLRSISFIEFPSPGAIPTGPSPILTFRTGQLNVQSSLEIRWNGTVLGTPMIQPSKTAAFTFETGWQDWASTNSLTIKNSNNNNDKHTLAFLSLQYPGTLDAQNQSAASFRIPALSEKSRCEITSLSHQGTVVVHDLTMSGRFLINASAASNVKLALDTFSGERNLVFADYSTGVVNVGQVKKFTPVNYTDRGQTYVILTSSRLRTQNAADPVSEYAAYRQSPQGGSHIVEIVHIEDLYNHFGYGIDRHFMAVKNFAAYVKQNWSNVKFILLLGKAIEYPFIRKAQDVQQHFASSFFIPTYGYLGSDNMLFSEGNYPDPLCAVGRVAARTSQEITDYLEKVMQYEAAPDASQTIGEKYWMKKVLHLGGGKNADEQAAIRFGLEGMESLLRDTIFGADVSAFYKRSGEEIQFTVNEEINQLFNNGLAIINFFGHSASSSWDFSIENPRNYNNLGRYPIIHSFGCFSGNLHGTVQGISESFVLEKNRGSISFLATTGTAFIPSLSFFGKQLHDIMLRTKRFSSEGQAIQQLIQKNRTARLAELALYSQITLHGDPAIRPYLSSSPDLLWDESAIKSNPEPVLASAPTFTLSLAIKNLGAHQSDSINLKLWRQLPSGKFSDTIRMTVAPVANTSTFSLELPTFGQEGVGRNTLYAIIDPENLIQEGPQPEAENNNQLNGGSGYTWLIRDNLARPVYPPNYSIVNKPNDILLRASTTSAPLEKTTYVFQIDTSEYFSSPLLENGKVESEGGLLEFRPSGIPLSQTVYYWRVSPDSLPGEGFKWAGASFLFDQNLQEGWNQSHFFQYLKNEDRTIEISEETDRHFEMEKNINIAKCRNKVWDVNDKPGFTFNNVTFGSVTPWVYLESGVAFVRYNQKTGQFYRNAVGGEYGSLNPTTGSIAVYPFRTSTPEERKKVIDFVENVIQEGEYVTFFTIIRDTSSKFFPEQWEQDEQIYGKSIYSIFEQLGAKKIRQLATTGSTPYFIQLFRNNSKGKVLQEELAFSNTDVIENTSIYKNYKSSAAMSSQLIGPSSSWKDVSVAWETSTITNRNTTLIYGVDDQGNQMLIDSISGTGTAPISADATKFPYLRLKAITTDTLQKEAGQLKFWRSTFDPLPDLAVRFIAMQPDPAKSQITQGQPIQMDYEIVNAGNTKVDSAQVFASWTGPNKQIIRNSFAITSLQPGQKTVRKLICTAPSDQTEKMEITVDVNPDNQPAELHRFNNLLSRSFPLSPDKINPQLQVFFDGAQILDGDLVSPRPEITVVLRDNNLFVPITNPSVFEIKLDTGRNQFLTIDAQGPEIRFLPAYPPSEPAKIIYTPTFKDGQYRLSVQGKDASGNLSGNEPYLVSFKVVNQSSISNVLNYPNPFSTSTQFIFTLTGHEIPDELSITIMTISGKVIRQISAQEIGPVRTGINKSEFRWDGSDDFGQKVANGVYLYKFHASFSSGKTIEAFKNASIDPYFTDGFGKMVILR
ncbi:MAG: C25 family cysteine peptidase [Saprospiraceae bacterium]|nr:C25 family cysteine peptidase [Saprospiraceae bacterium]